MTTVTDDRVRNPRIVEARGKLDAKTAELARIFEEAGPEMDASKVKTVQYKNGSDFRDDVIAREKELAELETELQKENALGNAARSVREREDRLKSPSGKVVHPGGQAEGSKASKYLSADELKALNSFHDPIAEVKALQEGGISLGSGLIALSGMFQKTDGGFKWNGRKNEEFMADLPGELVAKTVMSTGAGWDPENIRLSRWIPDAQRPIAVADIFPTFPYNSDVVTYMEETTFTNNAAEASESSDGSAQNLAESALAFTEQTSAVRKIGHTLPVTREQLEDVSILRGIIDQRLAFMVRQRLDLQLLVGNGTAPNLSGVHDVSGTNTQAKGTDSVLDAAHKGMTACRVTGFADPNYFVFHPNDWQDIRLTKTADGIYLYGSPTEAGPMRLWGLPVLTTTAETENQAAVGDFANFSGLFLRRGITLDVTDSHASEFIADIMRIKVTMRAAVVFFRPAAFTEITGI